VSRWWNDLVAAVAAMMGLPLLLLLLFAAATLVAVLWYWFPRWVPRRWPRLRRPHWRWPALRWPRWRRPRWRWPGWRWPRLRWRRSSRKAEEGPPEPPEDAAEEVPELPASDFADLADRLAAEGRYAEAVRERLRGIVRELIERGVLEHRPGWTVTELAAEAAARRPAVAAPLSRAGDIFSDIWYGQRPADATHDARMRELAAAVHDALRQPVGAAS
jgi:Domain of unknown function (DUF4129)